LGGYPIGPYASVGHALAKMPTRRIQVAILDGKLVNRDITPVASAQCRNARSIATLAG